MGNLLQLLLRYGGFLLFLLLEGICFYMIVRYNKKQNLIFTSTSNIFVGSILDQYDDVAKFIRLSEDVDLLRKENARLKSFIKTDLYDNSYRLDTFLGDSVRMRYEYIPVKVINNSIAKKDNHITLNKGIDHEVQKHMGVISNNGVIGVVKNSSCCFSSVMSILHRQTRISASIRSKGYFGSLVWNGENSRIMQLNEIPRHAIIVVGDTVETSGNSNLFPKGVQIGIIKEINRKEGPNSYDIQVELSNDIANLQYGYVIKDLMKKQLEEAIDE
ncbi:MAG: rod shape-determining protein MreC [Saprospiraceae bacterium]|jgi:rod shape-determining protein MreC|nr:rod shape-determining protein MreC [Saprospiraceae bacterium]